VQYRQKFDAQAEKFGDPSVQTSPQFRAEQKAFWRAVAVLCQEEKRSEYKTSLDVGTTSLAVIATALQIPARIKFTVSPFVFYQ